MASMRLPQLEYPSDPHTLMNESLPQYPSASPYAQAYYPSSGIQHLHPPTPIPRPDQPVRKRPKYTRSKTGCLTCRAKKVKCDEMKPDCTRCQQGQRECKWPEGVATRKKPASKKEMPGSVPSVRNGTRPSTACSSVSDLSTPPTRNHTPPKQEPYDIGLPPMASRRDSGDVIIRVPIPAKVDDTRVHQISARPHGYPVHANTHTHLISGPGMLDTLSQYPTHGSYHADSISAHHYPAGQSLALPRLSHPSQSPRFDNQWNSPGPQMQQHVDPMGSYFHTTEERNLVGHSTHMQEYRYQHFIMALPSENPVLAANLQLVFGRAPGSDNATEALRKALLGVAATHQSYLFSRSGASRQAQEAIQLANGYHTDAQHLLCKSHATSEGTQSDASLAASVALSLMDIFSGGYNWTTNLNTAKSLVNLRGGPAVLLARSSARSKSGSMTGVARARLFVEIVSVYDVFGSLAKGQAPTLLSPYAHCWWLESANAHDTQSHVEKCFGISRTFLPLFAKVTTLLSRSLSTQCSMPGTAGIRVMEDAQALYLELEDWSEPAGLPERIQAGNCIYKKTAQIALLREVMALPSENEVVQRHVEVVLSLCLDCGRQKLSVDLNWPVIIAGSQAFGTDRGRVLEIFNSFREQCCYEIETSERIVSEVWKRFDSGQPRADWRSVMRDHELDVLIL